MTMAQQPHDNAYKLLFSHREMVADLLRGYLARDWIDELDLTRLEIVTGSQVGDALSERRNDCVWRLPWKGTAGGVAGGEPVWLYIYLMLEFQSSVDPTMPVRMMAYLALLYQGLLRSGQITADILPPVLPVVLYNGRARWTAANRIEDLIPRYPAALSPYIPRVQYLFLDEGRMATSEQMEERNLAAAVFRLEQGMAPEALRELGRTLDAWLKAQSQSSLREALCTFVRRSIAVRRLPGAELPAKLAVTTQAGGKKGPEGNALRALFRQVGLETGGPGPALSPRNSPAWAVTIGV